MLQHQREGVTRVCTNTGQGGGLEPVRGRSALPGAVGIAAIVGIEIRQPNLLLEPLAAVPGRREAAEVLLVLRDAIPVGGLVRRVGDRVEIRVAFQVMKQRVDGPGVAGVAAAQAVAALVEAVVLVAGGGDVGTVGSEIAERQVVVIRLGSVGDLQGRVAGVERPAFQ